MTIFDFRSFREKTTEFFFQKTSLFVAQWAHFRAKQNVPLNFVSMSMFSKKPDQVSLCQILKEK